MDTIERTSTRADAPRPAARPRRRSRAAIVLAPLAALLTGAGCDVRNPTAVQPHNADPMHLAHGAMYQVEAQYSRIVAAIFLASDEGRALSTFYAPPDETGDASTYFFFDRAFTGMHHGRRLAADAIVRAEETGSAATAALARLNHGWILTRLAELWGAQPFEDGVEHSAREIFEIALADFERVIQLEAADTLTSPARAGIARVHWQIARLAGSDAGEHVDAAIEAARMVLDDAPDFVYEPIPARSNYLSGFGSSYEPTPAFADIPNPIPEPNTPITRVKFIDADELRLIIAEGLLDRGRIDEAKPVVKAIALLPVNHVGLGRAPDDPPLTDAEVDALIDPLDANGLRHVIEELRRENQFGYGRRSQGPNGPVLPIPLSPGA